MRSRGPGTPEVTLGSVVSHGKDSFRDSGTTESQWSDPTEDVVELINLWSSRVPGSKNDIEVPVDTILIRQCVKFDLLGHRDIK